MIGYSLPTESRFYIWFGIVVLGRSGLEYEKFGLMLGDILDSRHIPWTTCMPFLPPDRTERICIKACYMDRVLARDIIKLVEPCGILTIGAHLYTEGYDHEYLTIPYDLFLERDTPPFYKDESIASIAMEISRGPEAAFTWFDFENLFYLYHSGYFDAFSREALERLDKFIKEVFESIGSVFRGKELKILY